MNQPELWEELAIEKQWFHVVRAMIQDNKIKEMGVHAWAVYCVLKSYAALDTGRSYPGRDTVAEHIGVSLDTVDRALAKLHDMGIVTRHKKGRSNSYELTERLPMKNNHGDVTHHGEGKYVPLQFQAMLSALEEFAASGKLPAGGIEVKIVLNANFITQGEHGTVNNNVYQAPVVSAEVIPKGAE
jgi:DNA-binding transcriptional ArsR family regulator